MAHTDVAWNGVAEPAIAATLRALNASLPGLDGVAMRAAAVVHVIDADEEARRSLAGVLTSAGLECRGYSAVGAFLDAPALDLPGCLIVDSSLLPTEQESPEGFAGVANHPLVVTAYRPDVPTAVRVMKSGAVDFLEKPFAEGEILHAVSTALNADRLRRQLAAQRADLEKRHATLSPREKQVMALVTAGRLNKQAAGDLGLSEITIKAHRGSVMRKMSARTLADLVRMAIALGPAVMGAVPVAPARRRNGD